MTKIEIREIDKDVCKELICRNHYSQQFPRITKHWLGVFIPEVEQPIGAITLGLGTRPLDTGRKLHKDFTSKDYLEIGKMAMDDATIASIGLENKNLESRMLSAVSKWVKQNCPDVQVIYTMADGMMGKVGYVYQAANFIYLGSYWTDLLLDHEGKRVHPRSQSARLMLTANDEWLKANGDERYKPIKFKHRIWPTMDYLQLIGWRWLRGKNFRYAYPLNKRIRKHLTLNEELNQSTGMCLHKRKNPKDDALQWKERLGHRQQIFIPKPTIIT